jgi:hypothetical protein
MNKKKTTNSFIRLADYLIVGTLHILAVNSVQSLFNYYTEQLENTPTLVEIQSTNKFLHKKTDEEKLAEETAKEQAAQAVAAAISSNDPAQKEAAARKDMMMMPQVKKNLIFLLFYPIHSINFNYI